MTRREVGKLFWQHIEHGLVIDNRTDYYRVPNNRYGSGMGNHRAVNFSTKAESQISFSICTKTQIGLTGFCVDRPEKSISGGHDNTGFNTISCRLFPKCDTAMVKTIICWTTMFPGICAECPMLFATLCIYGCDLA